MIAPKNQRTLLTNYMKKHLFWVDLEMTGLDETRDHILEIAVAITDLELKIVHEYQKVVYQSQEIIDGMNDWCKENHGRSGLTAEIPSGTPLDEVEKQVIALCDQFFKKDDRIVIVGNSIGNDRRFIDKYMPHFSKRLHYRMIDVSSFKEIYRERYGVKFEKKNAHRALGDIRESVRELEHYLSFVKIPEKPQK